MIKKKILVIFFFLSACGYQIANNFGNNNFHITDYSFDGNKFVNRLIERKFLKNNNPESKIKYSINLSSNIDKNINSKNKLGESENLTTLIKIKFEIFRDNNLVKVINLKDSASYNTSSNKFEQKQYERVLIENMVENIMLVFYQNLTDIK